MADLMRGALCLSTVVLLVACGGDPDSQTQGGPPDIAASSESGNVLHEFQVGEETLSFVEYNDASGDSMVVLSEQYSAFAKSTLSDRAVEAAGEPLTMLELFNALAPVDEAPDEALIQAHGVETEALGRASNEPIDVDVDLSAPVEKSIASCEAFVYDVTGEPAGTYYGYRGWRDNVTGGSAVCLYDSCGTYVYAYTRAGTCNESNVTMYGRAAWGLEADGGEWVYTDWATMPPYTSWRLSMQEGASRRMAAIGNSSGTFHLRTGARFISH